MALAAFQEETAKLNPPPTAHELISYLPLPAKPTTRADSLSHGLHSLRPKTVWVPVKPKPESLTPSLPSTPDRDNISYTFFFRYRSVLTAKVRGCVTFLR